MTRKNSRLWNKIWSLVLCMCILMSPTGMLSTAIQANAAGTESVTGAVDTVTGSTDSTAGTAYGQHTGICTTCGSPCINGICSNADCTDPYQEPNMDDSGTVFLIENAGNLYWFAKHVNDGFVQANAKLTKNIIVNSGVLKEDGSLNSGDFRTWTPIGNYYKLYTGTFDGKCHTISGLYYSGSDRYVGLFGYIANGATIQNVGVLDSCFQVSDGCRLGGIVGYAKVETAPITISGCSSAALLTVTTDSAVYVGGVVGYVNLIGEHLTIQNCMSTGEITTTSTSNSGYEIAYTGGVAGYIYANKGAVTIQNCMSTGAITRTSASGYTYCGGVAGYVYTNRSNGAVTIQNCFSTGTQRVIMTSASVRAYTGGVAGYAGAHANADGQGKVTFSNCYYTAEKNCGYKYVDDGAEVTLDKCGAKSAEEFASGEVAYLLNGSTSEGTLVWKQTLGTDKTPSFTSTETVYAYTNCMGTTSYTNDSTKESGLHDYNNGICTVCGGYEEPKLVDGYYEIANAGNLYWFARKVNGGETSIKGKLTADIDLENREWTAIGTAEKPYTGTFDGGSFTVSNFKMTVTEGNNQGLFGAVSGGTVKNFTINGKIDITATIDISDVSNIKSISNVGAVVGYATSKAVIEKVNSYVNITDSHTPITYTDANGTVQSIRVSGIGGIAGYMDGSTVSYCAYDGAVSSVCGASIAGIVGNASNSSTVSHCTSKGTVTAVNNSAHIGGIAGDAQTGTTVSYCLNFSNVTSSGGDCIGGIVAYANQNVKIDNCGNLGTVNCTSDDNGFIGGILGYINNRNFKGITNCFNYGSIVTKEGKTAHAGAILGYNRNSGSVYSNNYYLDSSFTKAVSDNAISDVYSMTETQFTSGEVAYKLNKSTNAGAWKQTLGTDDYPNFTGGDVNYSSEYYNTHNNANSYDNGFCDICGGYEEPKLVDGYYEIDNAGNLYWFASQVSGGSTSINGKVTADITVNASVLTDGKLPSDTSALKQWTPIGNSSNVYKGTFDGDGHTISGLYYNGSDEYVGLFGRIEGDATIKNITVADAYFNSSVRGTQCDAYVGGIAGYVAVKRDNAVSISGCTISGTFIVSTKGRTTTSATTTADSHVGGLVGYAKAIPGGILNIESCCNTGDVEATARGDRPTAHSGGLVGYAEASSGGTLNIENCYNTGDVAAITYEGDPSTSYSGGLVGYGKSVSNSTLKLESCYNTGDVEVTARGDRTTTYSGGLAGRAFGSGNFTLRYCYYLNTSARSDIGGSSSTVTKENVVSKTADEFASGEVAYLLQKESGDTLVWGQTTSDDGATPIFTTDETYRVLPVKVGESIVNYSVLHRGDVNNSGEVDIYDYQQLINISLSESNTKSETEKYDLNGDGVFDVLDCAIAERKGMSADEYKKLVQKALDSVPAYREKADFDGDGVVDVLDVSSLERMLSGHRVRI